MREMRHFIIKRAKKRIVIFYLGSEERIYIIYTTLQPTTERIKI